MIDGAIAGGADRIRIKIFNKNTSRVIYDNQPGASDAADPLTVVGSGSTLPSVAAVLQRPGPMWGTRQHNPKRPEDCV